MDIFGFFTKFIKLVTHWATFVKYVEAAVITAEEDKNATGEEKRNAVVHAVLVGMKQDFGLDLTGYEKIIEMVINLIVEVLNAMGVFKHKNSQKG